MTTMILFQAISFPLHYPMHPSLSELIIRSRLCFLCYELAFCWHSLTLPFENVCALGSPECVSRAEQHRICVYSLENLPREKAE